ncbi:MAG: hypothetical protein GC179_06030 [Anaerolineaceae bacterium]|nr:hypothetical protein [Anaerolineaceae bacterium]
MDTGTLILIAIIVVAVVLLLKRLMPQQSPYSQQGPNRPQYNDPNISSHGGFGGNQQSQGYNRPQYDDPNIESHGGFGPSGGSRSKLDQLAQGQTKPTYSRQRTVERGPENGRRNDDPNVSSHGGFGGQR